MLTKLRNVLGILLIVAGVVAGPMPLIPGIPLIVAGVALLGASHPLSRFFVTLLHKLGLRKIAPKTIA